MKNGLTRRGPFSSISSVCSSKVAIPPIPVPMMTQIRVRSSAARSRPECFMACVDAAMAYWT